MFRYKKSLLPVLLAAVISLQAASIAMAKDTKPDGNQFEAPKLALKIDRYDKDQLPRNFRTCKDKLSGLTRDGVMPSGKGLEESNVSASSCFSEKELENVLQAIPAAPQQFYDIDLRGESHGYLDGTCVSWYAYKDWGNDGRSQDIIQHIETDQLNSVQREEPINIYTFNDDSNKVEPPVTMRVHKVYTEEQMLKKHGANYFRLAISDHFRPDDSVVDRYLAFYKQLPKDAWLHYHCYAGMGRTTIFMVMHDILKCAPQGVSFKDIIKRQAILGKTDLSDIPDSKQNWERQLYIERYRFTEQFYDYVVHHPALDMTYTQWARQHHYSSGETDYTGFVWRWDGSDQAQLPRNFRTCKGAYTHEISKKLTRFMDPSQQPTRQGLDSLNISGSAQMSVPEFKVMLKELKKVTNGPVYDIDLRQETHGYFDGQAVSWYGLRDWCNVDKKDNSAAILKEERMRLLAAKHSRNGVIVADVVAGKYDKYAKNPQAIQVREAQTEEEIAKSLGVHYYRITARDHIWPQPQYIDQFIRFYQNLPANAWLHFHCEAGAGRTTAFMAMVDIMQNPSLSLAEILQRQYLIGGNYVAYIIKHPKAADYKADLYADKARMINWFQKYVRENKKNNYQMPWSDWIRQHDVVS